jgi:surfeit locus 1 family protein
MFLGAWQLDRLNQKQSLLQDIYYRLQQEPIPLEDLGQIDKDTHNYRRVQITGKFEQKPLYVLTSEKPWGTGFQQILAFQTKTGRILVDRGYIPENQKDSIAIPSDSVTLEANLYWPNETGFFTPAPDTQKNIWFARDVDIMADTLNTDPILAVVQPSSNPENIWPRPVITDTRAIPNNHFQYAMTWFSLSLIWLVMSAIWIRRIRQNINYFK